MLLVINYIKSIIKLFLEKNDYRIVRKYYLDFDSDTSIKKIITQYQKNDSRNNFDNLIIFDVGANIGQSVDRFRKYSSKCKIFFF